MKLIPIKQAVLERHMLNMSKLADDEAHELQLDWTRMAKALTGDRNFSISCELDVRYPTLLFWTGKICICPKRWGATSMDMLMKYKVYVVYILYIYWLKYFDIPTLIFWYVMYMLCISYTHTGLIILIFRLKHFDMLCICCVYIYADNLFLSGTWLSPRSRYYAPEAATFQRV